MMSTQMQDHVIKILEKRYLGKNAKGEIIETPDDMFRRVAKAVSNGDKAKEEEFYKIMVDLDFLPNSPTLMNAGTGNGGTLSACFVIPVSDSLVDGDDSIMQSAISWAAVQKFGGGVGASFSNLRRRGAPIKSTHGISCGAVSVIKHYSSITDMVTQGGKRHGANMGILRVDHPEIIDFIKCKDNDKEIRNFNMSVGITDVFMKAVKDDKEYDLIEPSTGEVIQRIKARYVFDLIVKQAHKNGEPGLIFLDKMNKHNPTPEVGMFESTNPCFAGGMRLATNRGLLTFKELYDRQLDIKVATDNRVSLVRTCIGNGSDIETVELKNSVGVTMRPAVPVFKTRVNHPVYKLGTKCGVEVVATDDHKFFTPNGLKQLKDLQIGDDILIQSGAGEWSKDYTLPKFEPERQYLSRVKKGEACLPKYWSRDIGEVLGWVMGDGWVTTEYSKGRKIPTYAVGVCFNQEDQKDIMPKIYALLREWTGCEGSQTNRDGGVIQLRYRSCLYYLLNSLGVGLCGSLDKRVPESLWGAPKEAVFGFLSALFSADGTINVSAHKGSCSIRLTSSSLNMLKDVQVLLLNEGIYSSIFKRRDAGVKMMPDSNRNLKEYNVAEQYELIIDGCDRDEFASKIGFLNSKQQKVMDWLGVKGRKSNKHSYLTKVVSVTFAGSEDVYCTTEPETHSIIVNGCTTVQCGEQPLLPYESCNLGSINLLNMVDFSEDPPQINLAKLEKTIYLAVEFLDNVIDINKYPLPKIEEMTKSNRKIGLGVMGFADMLVALGVPYNSNDGLRRAEDIMRFIDEKSKEASMKLAETRGSFPNFDRSIYKKDKRYKKGMRNATTTTIAPTGTIGLIADVSQGVEPIFMVAQKRRMGDVLNPEEVMDGKPPKYHYFTVINKMFGKLARRAGIYNAEILEKVYGANSIQNIVGIPNDVKKVFRTAYDISPEWHIKMQAAFQKYTDNAVSKTANLPESATEADVYKIYWLAYDNDCKGVTVYRDNSRTDQVVSKIGSDKTDGDAKSDEQGKGMVRVSPERAYGYRERIETGCGALYVHLSEDEYGLCEVFTSMGQSGGCAGCLLNALGRTISISLRSGVRPIDLMKQLRGNQCPKPGGKIGKKVLSCADGVGIVLKNYLIEKGVMEKDNVEEMQKINKELAQNDIELQILGNIGKAYKHIGACPECGSSNFDQASKCPLCLTCGWTECS